VFFEVKINNRSIAETGNLLNEKTNYRHYSNTTTHHHYLLFLIKLF